MSHLNFSFLAFSTNVSPMKSNPSGNTVCQDSSKWTIFDELLSTQNVNVARFARNIECDFLDDFQTYIGTTL